MTIVNRLWVPTATHADARARNHTPMRDVITSVTRRKCAFVFVAATVLALSGCTNDSSPVDDVGPSADANGASTPPAASPTATRAALDCGGISAESPSEGRMVVLDSVALPDSTVAPALQVDRQQGTSPPLQRFFAKDGLGFRVGTQWRLTVSSKASSHLRIGWGSPPSPGTVVRSPVECRFPTDADWVWYPGGYWTDKPGCYSVVVEVGEQEQRVDVGIGKPCTGQRPPVVLPFG